ncbi:MAG TPA: hypothetical protein VN774_09815 [Candidatus Limnocylindrales bacterium]|nr:hypothetical protein [Candidatus Limnocylindrales bacterium]
MQRPTGVTILAVLEFLGAACLLMLGLLAFASGAFIAQLLAKAPGMGALAGGAVAVVGVVCLLFAALYGVTGYGLLALQNWGRIITMILVALGAIFGLLGLLGAVSHMTTTSVGLIIWQLIWLAIYVWILMYLNRPDVKQAFNQAG